MTNHEFRTMALEIPAAVERSHMNHPDFRVAGKIFASLGVPDKNWGMVKLTLEQQRTFIEKAPEVFRPSSGLGPARVHECLHSLRENEHCSRYSQGGGKERCIKEEENVQRRTSNAQRSMIQAEAFHSRYRAL